MNEEELLSFDLSVIIRDLGFEEECAESWYDNYRLKDEILQKHPGLSDDEYMELMDKYGGPYKREEMFGYYLEPLKIESRNTEKWRYLHPSFICSRPNIYQVTNWLRKKGVFLLVEIVKTCPISEEGKIIEEQEFSFLFAIYDSRGREVWKEGYFATYERAIQFGIKEILTKENEHNYLRNLELS